MFRELDEKKVWVMRSRAADYAKAPFYRPQYYREFPDDEPMDPSNVLYDELRKLFKSWEWDKENEDSVSWNPLKGLVSPGQSVVIKPNLVFHHHPLGEEGVKSMLTQGAVIRPIVDYVWRALEGKGEIVIADVPLQTADWKKIIHYTGLMPMVEYLQSKGVRIVLRDLRLERAVPDSLGVVRKRIYFNGDPHGYRPVNIGKESQLMPIIHKHKNFAITDYKPGTVAQHHDEHKNEYLIPQTILNADLFINVPKMKSHKKGGVTLSMKNLIGINGDKSWIAHHTEGALVKGGDEFPSIDWFDLLRYRIFTSLKNYRFGTLILTIALRCLRVIAWIQRVGKKNTKKTIMNFSSVTEGSWYGNDTLWRVICDLNRILLYADKNGQMQNTRQRRYISIIDGIWAGERNGPMHHIPKKAQTLVVGFNPVYVDTVASHFMGFDSTKIPQIAHAYKPMTFPLTKIACDDIVVSEDEHEERFAIWKERPTLAFLPPNSWTGKIEHSHRDLSNQTIKIPGILENVAGE